MDVTEKIITLLAAMKLTRGLHCITLTNFVRTKLEATNATRPIIPNTVMIYGLRFHNAHVLKTRITAQFGQHRLDESPFSGGR